MFHNLFRVGLLQEKNLNVKKNIKQKQTADLEVRLEEHKKAIFKRDLEKFSMVDHIQRGHASSSWR